MAEPSEPADLSRRLAEHLRGRPGLLPGGARVLVAVSGGPDSMALLDLLLGLSDDRDLTLAAAHFDHGLRDTSAGEAARVRGWMDDRGVPARVAGPARPLPARQEALRRARYRFLREVADELEADRIATGHHADDQAETVLFRILRGTGLRGLRGIPARRGRVVRPLLPFRRDEIEGWVRERGLPHLRDPSNRDPRWSRGRIRGRVLPALEEAWGAPVADRLLALSRHASRADRALDGHARRLLSRARGDAEAGPAEAAGWSADALRLRRGPLVDADAETRARAVRAAARDLGVRLTEGGTRAAVEFISEGRSGGRVDLGDGLVLAREFGRLWLGRPADAEPDGELAIDGPGPDEGRVWIGGLRRAVRWRRSAGPGQDGGGTGPDPRVGPAGRADGPPGGDGGRAGAHRVEIPLARVAFPLAVRGWRDGDRIRTPAGTRKLKRLFNDRRVPVSRRPRIPTLVTDSGETVWVAGLARDPGCVPEGAEERLVIVVEDA